MTRCYELEMSISHQDFFRLLPFALKGIKYEVSDDEQISVIIADGSLKIIPGDEHKRKIASLELPVLYIIFKFSNVSSKDISLFFIQFNRAYQRGGG